VITIADCALAGVTAVVVTPRPAQITLIAAAPGIVLAGPAVIRG